MVLMVLGGVGYFYYQNKPTPETQEIVNEVYDNLAPETSQVKKEIEAVKTQIILNELDKKRDEGKIQQIKSLLNSARVSAELYFDQNNGSYSGLCSANQTTYFPQLNSGSYPEGTKLNCNISGDGKGYAIQAMYSNSGWCVDSERLVMERKLSIGTKFSCL